jgi:glycosyltransferase involved in cell wall biosynthesis
MKIAILGTRGIPNHYGGFEQYADLLSGFLTEQGWEVVVYCSSAHPYQEKTYKNARLKHIYDPEDKIGTAGQFVYDLGCILDSRKEKFDLIYQLGYTSSAVFNFLFSSNTKIVTHMDGFEWKRSKYNKWVRSYLKYAERLVLRKSDFVVSDSRVIQEYLQQTYGRTSFYSAYTASIPSKYEEQIIRDMGLEPMAYNLLIARLEPENNVELIIDAYLSTPESKALVVIGNTQTPLGRRLQKKYKDSRLQLRGPVYDQLLLNSLRHFAHVYFHGHSVGGTNPSLLEAMACGCSIMAHDNPFNRSVLKDNALYFSDRGSLNTLLSGKEAFTQHFREQNIIRITNEYSTEAVFLPLMRQLSEWINH